MACVALLPCARAKGAGAEAPVEGTAGQIYAQKCAPCHEGGTARAPHAVNFLLFGPRSILAALNDGVMKQQGAELTPIQRQQLAEFLGGHSLDVRSMARPPPCAAGTSPFDLRRAPELDGWGFTLQSTRFIAADIAQLSTEDIPRLELAWAFAFPGATRARSQPSVAGGAIFVGSQDGTVYSLDFDTGCVRWSFSADAEVRVSVSVEPWRPGDRSASPRAFFGDLKGNVYALDSRSGKLLWQRRVNGHPHLTITGSPRYYQGRLYVPMSSTEFAAAADPDYPCCSFRGGVVALEASTGHEVWTAYSIEQEPHPTGERTASGRQRLAPAGVPIWNSPTIDEKRNRLYVGTGEAYTAPAGDTSDAVLAIDLDSGKLLWHYQSLAQDAWNLACFLKDGPNCPREQGPDLDLDIGAPPILVKVDSQRELLLVGQKSAHVFALDPNNGQLLWRRRTGRGGYAGGVHWGMAVAEQTLYAPSADTLFVPTDTARGDARPGLFALDVLTGETKWFAPTPDACAAANRPACDPGVSAAATAIPGAVFAGGFDGWLRAYAAASGKVLWQFDTAREFTTLSGARAHGGSIGSAGPVVVYGAVLVNSGYLMGGRMPGNVLLKFHVPPR